MLFFKEDFMSTQTGLFLNRRRFLQGSAALGVGALGLDVLAACGGSAPATPGVASATVNTLPPNTNPGAQYVFKQVIKQFEQSHPNEKIVGKTAPYDPATFFTRVAAGQAEDATQTYFTEPPLMISKHVVADITTLAKGWQYWSSYNPGIVSIATDPATGKIYGVPQNGYALGLFYNRKLFSAAGLNPDKPPATWEEFRSAAKALATSSVAGYAEPSISNQGGWRFTNWMYSAGGDMQSADGTKATFNSEKGISVLQMLKTMRFTDKSLTKQQGYVQDNILQLLATGKVAMAIMAPDQLNVMKSVYGADLTNFGIGAMPQNGGNAALTGGNIFVFNPKSSQEVIKAAFDYVLYSNFDLNLLESSLAQQAANGQVVGAPTSVLFTGDFQKQIQALNAKYATVPLQNYASFINSTVALRPEPRKETQKMYAALDPAVQAVLSDQNADPQKLLNQAAQQFQQVLDQAAS
jgi:multiple sugar transport system substrate-binding protein